MKRFSNTIQRVKKGFTLIETLVALAILTVVLGSTVTLARSLNSQAQKTEDISQMNSLADEAINDLRFLRDASVNSVQGKTQKEGNLSRALGFPGGKDTLVGAFVATKVSGRPNIENGGPVNLEWCHAVDSNSDPSPKCSSQVPSFVSAIGINDSNPACGANNGTCYVSRSNINLPDQLLKNNTTSFTLVAIRKTPFTNTPSCLGTTTNSNRFIVDTTTPLAVQKTCIYTSERADWDFYKRNIHIQRNTPVFSSDPNSDYLKLNTYRISVTITNYYDPTSSIIKSATVTDFQPNNLIYSR